MTFRDTPAGIEASFCKTNKNGHIQTVDGKLGVEVEIVI